MNLGLYNPGILRVLRQKTQYLATAQEAENQTPGTTFQNISDEVRPEGGHEKCCRFVTHTGVYQGAPIRSATFLAQWKRSELEQKNDKPL